VGERLKVHVFVDKPVVEVFANGGQAVMRRIYRSLKYSFGVTVCSRGGPAKVLTDKAWI